MYANSGENCHSRPGESDSPKRVLELSPPPYQLAQICFVLSELHACLDVGLNCGSDCMYANSGENCHSRPGELVSPRRESQKLTQGFARATRPGGGLWS
ncbi:hypothetical protein DEO72_LG1g3201 [Vigna unguiculata]|uniref:Uncharacterized protein n=1 Tax=Vigna unguiculata TaxID=3917 RepID=A0A4D6KW57_VIGUN|nr:hypothetical protein DEO72_LG1g3201 [Vigna unguiculata]